MRRLTAFILTALLLCSQVTVLAAADEGGGGKKQISIGSAEELAELSRNCRSDEYSIGLVVTLTEDIALRGSEFEPIPIFCGEFDGGGHEISDFSYTGGGTTQGLFRTIGEEGYVHDLSLTVQVLPTGVQTTIGGLCGENRGSIASCTVAGEVTAKTDVGGVVGINRETGIVASCASTVTVNGTTHTGGVCGNNEGGIVNCSNAGFVNTIANESAISAGGIAGLNSGSIVKSSNSGEVGYSHTGYNVGGIAGLHSGVINYCMNSGVISGRRDAGGIAGQMEPLLRTEYAASQLSVLDSQLGAFTSALDTATKDVGDYLDSGSADLTEILNDASELSERLRANANVLVQNGEWVDGADDAIQDLNSEWQMFSDLLDDERVQQTADNIDRMLEDGRDLLNNLSWVSKAGDQFDKIAADLRQIGNDLANSEAGATIVRINGLLQELTNASESERMDIVLKLLDELGKLSDQLPELAGAAEKLSNVLESLAKLMDEIEAGAKRTGQDIGLISEDFKNLRNDMPDIGGMKNSIDDMVDSAAKLSGLVSDGLALSTADIQKLLGDTDDDLGQLVEKTTPFLSSLNDASSILTGDITDLVTAIDNLRGTVQDMTDGSTQLTNDMSATEINESAGCILNSENYGSVSSDYRSGGIVGTIAKDNIIDPEDSENYSLMDSYFSDSITYIRATVFGCRNLGSVEVKYSHSGGVVGYGGYGAIVDSESSADVSSGTGYSGGVAGEMAGVIQKCRSAGSVIAESYAGGVAGSAATIRSCIAVVDVDCGEDHRGGVAGEVTGEAADNIFVDSGIGGVDGVDYVGRAVPISYRKLIAMDDCPDFFREITVTFMKNGEVFESSRVVYGGHIYTLPAVPSEGELYWKWDDFDQEHITHDLVIEGGYQNAITVLATDEEVPEILVQGVFWPESELRVSEYDTTGLDSRRAVLLARRVEVADGSSPVLSVRLRSPEDGLLYVNNGHGLTLTDYERDGSYIKFDMENGGAFVLLEHEGAAKWISVAAAAAIFAVLIGAGVLLLHHRKKRVEVSKLR